MAEKVVSVMSERGVNFLRGVVPLSIHKTNENSTTADTSSSLDVTFSNSKTLQYDTVIFATGRAAETGNLNLKSEYLSDNSKLKADLESGRVGGGVYAIGDVVEGQRELTPLAIRFDLFSTRFECSFQIF
jgi:pyruvate/2-oxoglutarate dehydrogenase complex dihydrolipoamide dehydrogenase (E3) component